MPQEKYTRIHQVLKRRIEKGEYPAGQLLPSENTLIGQFHCSRNTLRRAIAELVREGYVQSRQGLGVYNIYHPMEPVSYSMGVIESFRESAKRTGRKSDTKVILFEEVQADQEIARLTGFEAGTELFHLQRIHTISDKPMIFNVSYFRKDCMPQLTAKIAQGSIYQYLENKLGMSIVTSKRTITVEKMTELDQKWLDMGDYNCLAVVSNQTYNSNGIQFEFTQSRHHPTIFRFQDNAVRR